MYLKFANLLSFNLKWFDYFLILIRFFRNNYEINTFLYCKTLNETMKKVLFICNQNQHRSKTAEELFKDRFETRSAGLFNENPVTNDELSWADTVACMEEFQRQEIAKRFPKQYMQKKIISLNVPDIFQYNQKELIELLNKCIKFNH